MDPNSFKKVLQDMFITLQTMRVTRMMMMMTTAMMTTMVMMMTMMYRYGMAWVLCFYDRAAACLSPFAH